MTTLSVANVADTSGTSEDLPTRVARMFSAAPYVPETFYLSVIPSDTHVLVRLEITRPLDGTHLCVIVNGQQYGPTLKAFVGVKTIELTRESGLTDAEINDLRAAVEPYKGHHTKLDLRVWTQTPTSVPANTRSVRIPRKLRQLALTVAVLVAVFTPQH